MSKTPLNHQQCSLSHHHHATGTGNSHNETFTVVPDYIGHPPSIAHVLAPMFALKAASAWGGFKWLLLGDADTIFSIPAVLRFLNEYGLNADDPHMLSDLLVDCDPCTTLPCPLCRAPLTGEWRGVSWR